MANCLRVPMASSLCCSSSSSLPSPRGRGVGAVKCRKIPMPPLNPKDPFLSRLASLAAKSPDLILNRTRNSDMPPYLDLLQSPNPNSKLMATPAHVEKPYSGGSERRPRRPPPDLPSLLLEGRIVFIGMPLVPAVTELILAQLMYLHYDKPKEPIYLYINSTGTTLADGETVAMESDGFAIYDALMHMKTEIRTVNIGAAIGQACLLLAAGTKGKRCSLPNATAMIEMPSMPPTGYVQASDVMIRAREAIVQRDILIKLLAKHTGNSEETVFDAIGGGPFYMDPVEAKEFGVIDEILWRGQEDLMAAVAPPEHWDRKAGIRSDDAL
ncbi:ATP-dependent Clp protease, proteolytic subunit [Handroanthus impetiginosus]|uniref:ATP-dependent Clp protease proteolytic subunit n=1 Tax=Handroanthus impetiginosus TaxID=429701 RepID=A0A2G9IAA5_9LAMI|nr:ATP-dependent Clp protease, proteolytic subunit [Handroanthus impetiginosus]